MYNTIIDKRYFAGIEHYMSFFYQDNLDNIFSFFNKSDSIFSIEQSIYPLIKERVNIINKYYKLRLERVSSKEKMRIFINP